MADANEEPMIKTPSEFGHFLLEKELGHGGMGGVYLGRDRMLDRPVGIKVMLKSLGDDPTFVERFQREAQAAARLNHPNIAQIYSFGTEQGMPYIAMELCTGGSLDKDMEKNPGSMDPVKVMRLGRQLAEALALAAEQGLVHGDVKPENVLYDTEGNAKLVDFGLAAMQGDSNEIWGTPYYISPEKVRRQPIDYRADIYSLGGTLYHALTGQPPFEGVDATAVVKARFEAPPPKPSAIRPEIPKEIDDIIMRMLELEPSMRYPTYESLLGDMRRYLDKAGPEKTVTTSSRIRLKGKKPKMRLSAEGGIKDEVPDLTPVGEGEEEKKGMSVGVIVALVVVGIFLLIGAVVGALIWYKHAEKASENESAQQQIVQTRAKARDAIAKTKKAVADFGTHFADLVSKSEKEMKNATAQVKACLTDEMIEAIGGSVQPSMEDSVDIAEAKAFAAAEEAKAAKVEADVAAGKAADAAQKAEDAQKEADAKAAASTNAPAATATNAAPAKVDAKKDDKKPDAKDAKKDDKKPDVKKDDKKPDAKDAKKDDKKPDAKDAKKDDKKPDAKDAKKDEKKADEKPAEEPAEEKPAEPAKPPVELPPDLKNFVALWHDFYFCRAADIRVQCRVSLLLKQIDKTLVELTGNDAATAKKLAEYSNKVVDELGDIKAMKCVEQTLKKSGVIKSKSANLVKAIEKQAGKAKARAEKAAKEKAAKEAAEAKAAKEAEEHKAKVEEEVKIVQDKWDALALSLVRHLSWDLCKKQLAGAGIEFTTQEGRDEIKMYQKRVEMLESFQRQLINKGRGTTIMLRRGNMKVEVTASTKNEIKWNVANKVKGKFDKGKDYRADWERFYQKSENRLLMKYLISKLVDKGQDDPRTRLGPMNWANNMLGAAMTMQLFMADDPQVDYAKELVKKAVEGFEPCRKYAVKFFPDVEIGAAPEEN